MEIDELNHQIRKLSLSKKLSKKKAKLLSKGIREDAEKAPSQSSTRKRARKREFIVDDEENSQPQSRQAEAAEQSIKEYNRRLNSM